MHALIKDSITGPHERRETGHSRRAPQRLLAALLCVIAPALVGIVLAAEMPQAGTVRVGVEQYPPIVYVDDAGQPRGLAIELIQRVAARQGWDLEFVREPFSELLEKVTSGEIDLLPAVAYTEARAERFRYGAEPFLANWGEILAQESDATRNLLDLDGKRVAVMKDDVHGRALLELADRFDIEVTPVTVPNYTMAAMAVVDGDADAAVTSRLFSHAALELHVEPTGIVLNPVELFFVAPHSAPPERLAAIDALIRSEKRDPSSEYQQSVTRWLARPVHAGLPREIVIALGGILALLVVVGLVAFVFRVQVKHRTRQLDESNRHLATSKERLLTIVNSMVDAVVVVDDDGITRFANPACGELFGREPSALIGEPFGLPQTDKAVSEITVPHRDGPHTVEMRSVACTWESDPARLLSFRDVTERVQTQVKLQRFNEDLEEQVAERTGDLREAYDRLVAKEEEIRSVVECMNDAVVTIDEHGIIQSANPALEKILGYAPEEVIGENVYLLMPEPERSEHDHHIERYLRTGQARIIGTEREVNGQHKDGKRIPLDLSINEYNVHGDRYFTGILRDSRERKRVMAKLKRARKEAEEANRAKSAFLATMSHEIRTPMNGVVGMLDVLGQTSLKSDQVEMVGLICESAYALLGIIEDILDFSKIEAGKLELEHAPLPPAEVVEKACALLDTLAHKRQVELTLFTDPALPVEIMGDALRLRQVIVNLVTNAIKFSSGLERPGRVAVRALMATHCDDAAFEIRVADNGIGMDEAMRARLFTPFTQADSTTTRRYGGTGLGLTITGHLVEGMGGEIEVASAPDAGSVFTVRLPLELAPGSPEHGERVVDLEGVDCLVLVDDEGLGQDFAIYLTYSGARVETFTDIKAVQKTLEGLSPGMWLVVIDTRCAMPSVDVLRETCRAHTEIEPHFVVLEHGGPTDETGVKELVVERGRRRRPRIVDEGLVTVDGDLLRRETFLRAVGMAAGRLELADEPESSADAREKVAAPSREEAQRQGRLLLVAEDNETNQKVIRQQLDMLGYAADLVDNGKSALARWRVGGYGLLLTDLHMPEMDGYALTATIRDEEPDGVRLPIVALTANALKDEEQRCLEAGMDGYLSKPARLADLKSMLARWLPGRDDTAPSATPADDSVEAGNWRDEDAGNDGGRNGEPVDVAVLADLVGNDPAMLAELLRDFRRSATTIAGELREAWSAGRADAAADEAHKLKSAARSVGAMELGEISAAIETAGRADDAAALEELLPRFDAEMGAVDTRIAALTSQSVDE